MTTVPAMKSCSARRDRPTVEPRDHDPGDHLADGLSPARGKQIEYAGPRALKAQLESIQAAAE
jgi:hypothetical protein